VTTIDPVHNRPGRGERPGAGTAPVGPTRPAAGPGDPRLRRGRVATPRRAALPLLLAMSVLVTGVVDARAFILTRLAISGGAVSVSGGSFRLGATAGEAGVVGVTSGGSYRLHEGFWSPGSSVPSSVSDPIGPPAGPPQTDRDSSGPGAPAGVTALLANSPNPFLGSTALHFTLERPARASLSIYDVAGRRVRVLLSADLPAGGHRLQWDGRDDAGRELAGGVYYSRLEVEGWSGARALLLAR